MKRFLAICFLCLLAAAPIAAQEIPLVELVDVTGFSGQTVDMEVRLTNRVEQGVAGVDVVIKTVGKITQAGGQLTPFKVAEPKPGTDVAALPGTLWDIPIAKESRHTSTLNEAVEYRVVMAQSRPFTGPGQLLRIPIQISEDVMFDSAYPVQFGRVVFYTADGRPISVATRDGLLTVRAGRYGDLNGDGYVTVGDAILAIRIAIGQITAASPAPLTADQFTKALHFADVVPLNPDGTRGDGRVTIPDATAVLSLALGIPLTGGTTTGTGGGTAGGG
jgi:hypothetical protein